MGEILQFPVAESALLEAAEALGWEALAEVTIRYGTGVDDQAQECALAYHNTGHTMDVRENSLRMARFLGFSALDQALVVLAASAHDIVQLQPRGVMEQASADWLQQAMLSAGFGAPDRNAAQLAVLATTPRLAANGSMTGQLVSELNYSDHRSALIAACVASADMAKLYAPDGPLLGRAVYKEAHGILPTEEPRFERDDLLKSQQFTIQLLQSYHYPHPAGEQLFGALRPLVIAHQLAVTQDIWLGQINSWQQLIDRDWEFARSPVSVEPL